jgi:hypothetical protein
MDEFRRSRYPSDVMAARPVATSERRSAVPSVYGLVSMQERGIQQQQQRCDVNAADCDHFRRTHGSIVHPDWKVMHASTACNREKFEDEKFEVPANRHLKMSQLFHNNQNVLDYKFKFENLSVVTVITELTTVAVNLMTSLMLMSDYEDDVITDARKRLPHAFSAEASDKTSNQSSKVASFVCTLDLLTANIIT